MSTAEVLQMSKAVHMIAYAVYYVMSQVYAEPDCQAAHLHNTFKKCAPYAPDYCCDSARRSYTVIETVYGS